MHQAMTDTELVAHLRELTEKPFRSDHEHVTLMACASEISGLLPEGVAKLRRLAQDWLDAQELKSALPALLVLLDKERQRVAYLEGVIEDMKEDARDAAFERDSREV